MDMRNILPTTERRQRFWTNFDAKVKAGPDGCHIWVGRTNKAGYGLVEVEVDGERYRFMAHRVAYQRHGAAIPHKFTIDHLCEQTRCMNKAHHEPVTRGENTRRQNARTHNSTPGTRCKNSHDGEYRRDPKTQKLYCKGCIRERVKRLYWKNKAE